MSSSLIDVHPWTFILGFIKRFSSRKKQTEKMDEDFLSAEFFSCTKIEFRRFAYFFQNFITKNIITIILFRGRFSSTYNGHIDLSIFDYRLMQDHCKKDRPKGVAFFIVLVFFFGSTLKLEKQFLKNLKNIFNVYL